MKIIYTILVFIFTYSITFGQSDSLALQNIKIPTEFIKDKEYIIELQNSYKIVGFILSSNKEQISIQSKITGLHILSISDIKTIVEYNDDFIPILITKNLEKRKELTTYDGKSYKGVVVQKDNNIIITNKNETDTIPIYDIKTIGMKNANHYLTPIANNRLMVGKTAIPLEKGNIYYKTNAILDYEVIYAVEKWFSISGGTNFIFKNTGLDIGFYSSANIGFKLNQLLHIGGTVEFAYNPRLNSLFVDKSKGLAYATITFGTNNVALNTSLGYTQNKLFLSKAPIWSISGFASFNRFQFLFEYWKLDPFINEEAFGNPLTDQATFFGVAIRFAHKQNIFEFGFGAQEAFPIQPTPRFGFGPDFLKFPISLSLYHKINRKKNNNHSIKK